MKSVLITGAGRGIGRALLEEFWQQGYYVYPVVRKVEHRCNIEEAYEERCTVIMADITTDACGEAIRETVGTKTGVLDVVINNAGVPGSGHQIESVELEEVMTGFKVHCLGALNVAKASLPYLRRAQLGRIINISSRLGSLTKMAEGEFKKRRFSYSYRIGKAAQNMLTICLNKELALNGENIGVVAIHPGLIVTDSSARDATESPERGARRIREYIEKITPEDFGTYQYPGHGEFPW